MNARLSFLLAIFISAGLFATFNYYSRLEHVTFGDNTKHTNGINVLLMNIEAKGLGGREIHAIHLYNALKRHGHNPVMLVEQDGLMKEELIKYKVPYYACKKFKFSKNSFFPRLYTHIKNICIENNIQIINTDVPEGLNQINAVSDDLSIKKIFTWHNADLPTKRILKKLNMDGIIGVSRHITEKFEKAKQENKIQAKKIMNIFPFFDETKFSQYQPSSTRKQFYKDNFNINIKDLPIVSCIARLDEDKCHETLIEATHKLVYVKNKPIQLFLAGRGEKQKELEKLTKKLNLQDYVTFLGYTDKISDLLYHSDIKALASKGDEGCPIALIEASFLKKPLIAHPGMGTEHTVIHEKTGLMFQDNLELSIERLIDNPKLAKELGQNAYQNVMNNFSIDSQTQKIINLYREILKT